MHPNIQPDGSIINVLDHGFVRFVDSMGSDLSIVRAARVSYAADWRANDDTSLEQKDEKLISYLLANKHTSPFESVVFTFEIKCPIFIRAQWHRHRTWSYNEVSARYTELPEEFYVPEPELIGKQSDKNKQMRDMYESKQGVPEWNVEASELLRDSCVESFKIYRAAIARGIPRELARSVLPMATYTRFFATVDLHNLFHFLKLRMHSHAQYEIQVYAEVLYQFVLQICPVAAKAWWDLREMGKI